MSNLIPPNPIGWNEWDLSRNLIPQENGIIVPDIPFPVLYTPASAFWLKSFLDHCLIYFLIPYDKFSQFLLTGGASGTLDSGSLEALAVVYTLSTLPANLRLGIGYAPGPSCGYCIGDKFKQQVYVRLDGPALVDAGFSSSNLPIISSIELLQNYKYKRIYVYRGEVTRFVKDPTRGYVLTLDISSNHLPPSDINLGGTITITKPNGTSVLFKILKINPNWDLIVSDPPSENFIKAGDFYQLSSAWCIEDPFLLGGIWTGPENAKNSITTSGLNLYTSSQNKPYKTGKFLGVYLYKNTSDNSVVVANIGVNMRDAVDLQWQFFGFNNSNYSKYYKNDNRYKEVYEETTIETPDQNIKVTTSTKYVKMDSAVLSDYNFYINNTNTKYIRVELSNGADRNSHNWYASCLRGSYLKNKGKLFKIIDHPEALILDISIVSIDGTEKFNPLANQEYEIINESAWMICEHYDGFPTGEKRGVFKGKIESFETNYVASLVGVSTNITLNINEGDSSILWYSYNNVYKDPQINNNFVERYRKTHIRSGAEPLKQYNKFSSWKLVMSNGQNEYPITSIEFPTSQPTSFAKPYSIRLIVLGELKGILNQTAYISFDSTYPTLGNSSKESGSKISVTASGYADKPPAYIVTNYVCLDGEYFSNPYSLEIPKDTRIGCCDGYYFGIEIDGTAASPIGLWLSVTTPRAARGVASLYHAIHQEDWIIYQDSVTKRLTIRKGCLDFKEYPQKSEVVIGKPKYIEDNLPISDGTIELNDKYNRVRRIMLVVPNYVEGEDRAFLFAVGSPTNYYGFVVSGDGLVDLKLFRKEGMQRGAVPAIQYTNSNGSCISPVYMYKKGEDQYLRKLHVDMGIDTEEGSIYVLGDKIEGPALVQYIDNNQTLKEPQLFDLIRLSDGELFLIYGKKMSGFKLGSYQNNDGDTQWDNSNAVMILGSYDDAYYWGSPSAVKHSLKDPSHFPTMFLNSVEYLGCIYDNLLRTINIFVRAFQYGNQYLGMFSVAEHSISHKLLECTANNTNEKFMWRHPLMLSDFLMDKDASWTDNVSIIYDGVSYSTDEDLTKTGLPKDKFIRVLGPFGLGCQVQYANEFGIISCSQLSDGSYILFYDTETGIRSVTSMDSGRTWSESGLIYARSGRCGVIVDKYFFYIAESGIEIKFTSPSDFTKDVAIANKKAVGNNTSILEVNSQINLDKMKHFLIGSGPIDYQRLSGYTTHDGTLKIFFYDENNILKCMESTNALNWIVADNF